MSYSNRVSALAIRAKNLKVTNTNAIVSENEKLKKETDRLRQELEELKKINMSFYGSTPVTPQTTAQGTTATQRQTLFDVNLMSN